MSAPSLEEIIEANIETALGAVETAQLGLVTEYDAIHHSVSVQPLAMKEYEREGQDPTKRSIVELIKQPIIPSVPIWFLGAGEARITYPVPKGSTVLLVHLSHAKAAWQFSDGTKTFDPGDTRRHTLTDCVAIPGGLTASVAAKHFSSGHSRIKTDALIFHTPGKIYLGGGFTEPIARKSDLDAIMNALTAASDAMQALITAGGAPAIAAGPAKVAIDAIKTALQALGFPICSNVTESE